MNFFFTRKRASQQSRLLEVEVLEDRLPLSASPLSPAVLPLANPVGPPMQVAPLAAAAPANSAAFAPPFAAPATATSAGQPTNPFTGTVPPSPGFGTTPPFGTPPPNTTAGSPGVVAGLAPFGSFSWAGAAIVLNQQGVPSNGVSAPLTQNLVAPLNAIPEVGLVQQAAPAGIPTIPIARQISGIDSNVFDARTGDRVRLRDQRSVSGMGDESGLLLTPQKPVTPTTPSPSHSPAPSYSPPWYEGDQG